MSDWKFIVLFILGVLLFVPCLMLVDWSYNWLACQLYTNVNCTRIHLP
jgi:hypothetical protein